MQTNQPTFIDIAQLRVGLYIHLDLGWMDHPFTISNFKVSDEEQISKIRKTGLKKLRYDPKRSDCDPLPAPIAPLPTPVAPLIETLTSATTLTESESPESISKSERLKQLRHAIDENEKKFIIASDIARQATRNILTAPKTSIEQAELLVNEMVDTALTEGDIAIHALNGNRSDDKNYQHALNVTVLALMMAKSIEMSKEDARLLGMAAIFHDIGKAEITDKILMKKDPLTKSERSYFEQHSEIGARMAKQAGLPDRIAKLILQHHEHADGTGYPKRIKTEQTDPLARLLALVNVYDNLCNPNNTAIAKTPYEALAHMFANQRSKLDESLIKRLIKSLGIYPPGSIVQLSTGIHAIVIAGNPNKPLRPFIMLHDPLTDRHEPLIIDLREEPNINISICLRPNQLPPDVFNYLNPRKRISYFFDAELLKDESNQN